ncbi:MAG TPA: ABC transporter ATP-binding protein [Phycisphaerales bacterium]|nr:ABC transporter ATP-binding protein [Phycisphaerales bacterium]
MPETAQNVIETAGLTKVFRDFWLREKVTAVADLDLAIRPHEVFGLLGPNGSGKSTTLKMILGLLFPTRGRIAVFGRRPTDVMTKARIGFLPEETYLYPFLNAHETLDYYGRLFHQPRRERRRRTEMLLEMVGLGQVAYRRIGEYSKGMQRRIGLAQALINDPDLLILDEPTSGMDPIGTRQIKDLILTLGARGKTVVLSSHLLADVEDVCDRVCILYGGRIRRQGDVRELLAQQGRTQIVTSRLDDATLQRIRETIVGAGGELLGVEAPQDKLEDLFLRIVDEAQKRRIATGGAMAGGEVAEFLRAEPAEGRQVIEELVSAAQPETPEKPPAPASAEPVADRQAAAILQDLLEAGKEPAPEEPAEPDKGTPGKPSFEQTDRGLIEGLMDSDRSDQDKPDDQSGEDK